MRNKCLSMFLFWFASLPTLLWADPSFRMDFEDFSVDPATKIIEKPDIQGWQFNSYYHVYDVEAHGTDVPQGRKAMYIHSGQAKRILENIRPNHIYEVKLAIAANDAYSAKNSFIALQAIKENTFDTVALRRFSDILDINQPSQFAYTTLSFDASAREDLKGYPIQLLIISQTMVHIDDISAAVKSNQSSNVLTLENDHVSFVFLGENRSLASMYDKKTGREHINRVPGASYFDKPLSSTLWQIQFANGSTREYISSRDFPATSSSIKTDSLGRQIATLTWDKLSLKNSPKSVDIVVTVTLPPDSGIASWEINIDNQSQLWGLYDLKFPLVTGMLKSGEYDIAAPRKNMGVNHRKCKERLFFEYGEGWWGPGQFMCADLDGQSVYMATHDSEAWPKYIVCEPGKEFFVQSFPKNMGVKGSDFKAPYPVMLGCYQGNWMDCCKIYRRFAVDNVFWLPKKGSDKKATIPQRIKDIGMWVLYFPPEQATVEEINKPLYELQKSLDAPIGVHWYNWHANVFDHQLPNYLPAKPIIAQAIRELADNENILVMPYINARVISCDIEDFDEYTPWLCKDENGMPYHELYGAAPNTLVMCPSTQMWQNKIYDITRQVIDDLKVKAIYLDQVSAAPIKLCYDKKHGHPLGGGDWWVKSYHTMLEKLRTIKDDKGDPIAITTEFAAEPYMGATDNFLIWMAREPQDLPMLQAVYSDYTFYFGSNNYDPQESTWKLIQLRCALWGIQSGWMRPDFILDPQNAYRLKTMKQIVDFRKQAKKYLAGELVDLIDGPEPISVIWDGKNVEYPAMQASVWKYDSQTLAVFVANYSDSDKEFRCEILPSKYGMMHDGSITLQKAVEGGTITLIEVKLTDETPTKPFPREK